MLGSLRALEHAAGRSGFAWSWLRCSAAGDVSFLRRGQRARAALPPAIIAQAAATLAQMFPGRFWVALGSGEAMNEHITGERWPAKSVRNARLRECVDIMRALFAGETVAITRLVRVDRARLWTLPEKPPPLIGAGQRGDGGLGWKLGRRFGHDQPANGEARADDPGLSRERGRGKPLFLQIHVAYGRDQEAALGIAYDQWRTNVFRRRSAGIWSFPRCLKTRRDLCGRRISWARF